MPLWKFDAYVRAAEALELDQALNHRWETNYLKNKIQELLLGVGYKVNEFDADVIATKDHMRHQAEVAAEKHKADKSAKDAEQKKIQK